MTEDPLLQPFQLKHLTLKNRVMTSSHEPAYAEGGLPRERYRAYHEERALPKRRNPRSGKPKHQFNDKPAGDSFP